MMGRCGDHFCMVGSSSVCIIFGFFIATMATLAHSLRPGTQKLSILSWNVNGIRSLFKHDPNGSVLKSLLEKRNVDVLCLQETKLQSSHVPEIDLLMTSNFGVCRSYWASSTARKGYSGTATLLFNRNQHFVSDQEEVVYGIKDPESDLEGRAITIECERFVLVNTYVPNSGADLVRLPYRIEKWDIALATHINMLKEKHQKPVLLVGDLNVAHTVLDYHNPQEPRTKLQAGTTPQEQASFGERLLQQCDLVDTFRHLYPHERRYSYYSARLGERGRAAQMGMRLDYVLHTAVARLTRTATENRAASITSGVGSNGENVSDGGSGQGSILEAYIEDQVSYCSFGCDSECVLG